MDTSSPSSSASANFTIRAAHAGDLPALAAIYNHYVEHSVATFDMEPWRVEERRAWFEQFDTGNPTGHPIFVAVDEDRVLGYAYYLPYRPKPGYAHTRETTIYLDPNTRGRGIGTALYKRLIDHARQAGVHTLLGILGGENRESVALHLKFGFELVGHYRETGRKFGDWVDTYTYQLMLK